MTDISRKLEDFRPPYESDDQWSLRKKFLERHWGKFEKNRLICLSQIFINMEFFGCKYNDQVCEEVAELAGDLAVERRETRAAIIEKTFVKAPEPEEPSPKRGRYGQGGGGGRASLDASAKPLKSPFAAAQPRRLGEDLPAGSRPAKLLAKDKLLILLKAQLTVMPGGGRSAMDRFNLACNRAKLTWKIHYDEEKKLQYVTVADVLVTKQAYGDKAQGREAGCRVAAERLLSVCLECREEEHLSGQIKLGLYTSMDKRQGWEGPEDRLFDGHLSTLSAVRDSLDEFKEGFRVDPLEVLQTACKFAKTELKEDVESVGWKRQKTISVAGVALWSGPLTGKEKPDDERKMYEQIGDLILKPHHRVYEDDAGVLRLLAQDKPITDEQLRSVLAKPGPTS